ncbi:hypothetical protein DYB37_001015 [Aphanomyces astaci]|uniref:T-complex protein 1 subunit gamma n=2 Tax=Aphanomyces astaci TaxID=112090 RepID=A0A3R7BAA6_APHAT|nr:hypothetical protein DYB35_001099 [Aphanomyces astaci]RHZ23039.1 hypothetical protein DYB37_001015 [Aphanomyces astaci]
MCSKDALSKALMASQSVQLKDPKIVQFINKPSQLPSCQARLLAAVVVGLDTETKPEFRKTSTPNATSLLQVAVRDVHGREDVFLFDLLALSPSHYDHMLADLFQNPAILKLGQGLLNDLKASYPSASCFTKMQGVVEVNALFRELEGPTQPMMSLQKLVYYSLKRKLVKTHQKSNWNRRPLAPGQVTYAALDALVLMWIFDDMCARICQLRPAFTAAGIATDLDVLVPERYVCPTCRSVFKSDHAFYNHSSKCRDLGQKEDRPCKCHTCPRRFVSESALAQHAAHCTTKANVSAVVVEDVAPCYCGRTSGGAQVHRMCEAYRMFASAEHDNVHVWSCVDCEKAFDAPELLLYHHGLCRREMESNHAKHVRFDKSDSDDGPSIKRPKYRRTASDDFTDSAEEEELWSQVGKCLTIHVDTNTQRETGRTAQLGNIQAAKVWAAVSEIVRTTLGPRSMLKMLLDPMGGIVMTSDGNAILREVDVSHPAAKSMIELSRAQDEEVGDGTTSVIILAGEMLVVAEPFLSRQVHPTVIIRGYHQALQVCLETAQRMAKHIDIHDKPSMRNLIMSSVGTKYSPRVGNIVSDLALEAVLTVMRTNSVTGKKEVDVKRYAKVEKIPGGELEESRVLSGVMFNKDVTHSKMRRRIENPRVLLLDCPLEYKKGESQTNVELTNEQDWNTLLRLEEEYIENLCAQIVAMKPDIVITEKGVSDLAQHYFVKANITCFRRLRKTDNNRVARATGATVVSRADEIQDSDIGTKCGVFEVRKIADEYFAFFEQCQDPGACTILLRGGSKDVLNEIERNLQDALQVARNVVFEPLLLPGGGATEMRLAHELRQRAHEVVGVEQWPFKAVADALEVIPRTLLQNCGADVVRVMTALRAKVAASNGGWAVDGVKGVVVSSEELAVWEPFQVKTQTIKTAVEAACMLLRIDDIVSGLKKKN